MQFCYIIIFCQYVQWTSLHHSVCVFDKASNCSNSFQCQGEHLYAKLIPCNGMQWRTKRARTSWSHWKQNNRNKKPGCSDEKGYINFRCNTRHAGHICLGLDGTCAVCGSHQWRSLSNIIWFRKCCNTLLSLQVCSVLLAKFKLLKPLHKMNRLFIHWVRMDPIYRCFCLAVCVQSFAHKNA